MNISLLSFLSNLVEKKKKAKRVGASKRCGVKIIFFLILGNK